MQSPNIGDLPKWVPSFCCVAPFVALVLLAIAQAAGFTVGTASLVALVALCGKTTHWVLRPNRTIESANIRNGT